MLSGTVPASLSFPKARGITLANNKLTGHLPWSGLLNSSSKTIEIVAVNANSFEGTLPQKLPTSLQHFVAHDNLFNGYMPSFAQTPGLKTLSVHYNALGGRLTLPGLQEWNASCSDISDSDWVQRFLSTSPTIPAMAAQSCKEVLLEMLHFTCKTERVVVGRRNNLVFWGLSTLHRR